MADVTATVQEAIEAFPGTFTNRTEVLHHVLCILGGGYAWSADGEPVYRYPAEMKKWTPEAFDTHWEKYFGDLPADVRKRLSADLDIDSRKVNEAQIAASASERALNWDESSLFERRPDGIYPQSGACLLATMPSNVSDDWRAACEQMRQFVTAHSWKF